MRVLLAPQEIAGYMGRLKAGLLEQGVEARFYDLTATYASYGGADTCAAVSALRRAERALRRLPAGARRMALLPLELCARLVLCIKALAWADAIVFGFAATYLWGLDLPLYRAFGKKIALIYFGSDSRPAYLNGKFIHGEGALSPPAIRRRAARQRRRIRRLDRYADLIVDHPPTGQFHERPFVPFLHVGLPAPTLGELGEPSGATPVRVSGAAIVVHAPSAPLCKGSARIGEMVRAARAAGNAIEYVELRGRSNAEVLASLRGCDFVVDELYSDSVLAGLGTEAAALGKATLVAGYAGSEELGARPEELPPAFCARPDTVEDTFRWMLAHPEEVRAMGGKARAFIAERWTGRAVAGRFLASLERPMERAVEPRTIGYHRGWGVGEEELRIFLREYLRRYGPGALYLDDKPGLRDAIAAFASGSRA